MPYSLSMTTTGTTPRPALATMRTIAADLPIDELIEVVAALEAADSWTAAERLAYTITATTLGRRVGIAAETLREAGRVRCVAALATSRTPTCVVGCPFAHADAIKESR